MSNPASLSSDVEDEPESWRLSPFRVWLLCAMPWLAAVVGLTLYDHHRAIGRAVAAYFAGRGAVATDAAISARAEYAETFVSQSLIAATRYCGEAIGFYGILPAGLTFVLFVVFLPWAVRWAGAGSWED
jgi:hypothetical protein